MVIISYVLVRWIYIKEDEWRKIGQKLLIYLEICGLGKEIVQKLKKEISKNWGKYFNELLEITVNYICNKNDITFRIVFF